MKQLLCILTVIVALATVLPAQNNGELLPLIYPVFTNVNGVTPVALGFVCTTTSGTNTNLATYRDTALTVANANPILLNAYGRAVNGATLVPIFLLGQSYRITLYAAGTGNTCNGSPVGTQIWQQDGVYNLAELLKESFVTKLDDKVCHAAAYTGTTPNDAGGKIAACIAALPSTGGTIDACGLEGAQTISSNVFSGATKPGELLLCAATFTLSAAQEIPSNWKIICTPATQINVAADLPNIAELSTAAAALYAKASTTNVEVNGCRLTGPYSGTGTSGTTFGLYAGSGATNVRFINNKVSNFSWSGIHLFTGSGHLVQGNTTSHNAIDGIETWAINSKIVDNYSNDDGAAAANGVGCIEIIGRVASPATATSDGLIVAHNDCIDSNHQGIVMTAATSGNTYNVTLDTNFIKNPGQLGISGASGYKQVKVLNNTIDTTRGSASLGRGISIGSCTDFSVNGNHIYHTNTGMGPNGIEVASCENGEIFNNHIVDAWVSIAITGTTATTGIVLIEGNNTSGAVSGTEYSNTSSGTKVRKLCNAFGATITTCPFPGTVINDSAAVGDIGEHATASLATGSATLLVSGNSKTVISISLTAGNWLVSGSGHFQFAATTSYTVLQVGISSTNNALGPDGTLFKFVTPAAVPTNITDMAWPTPIVRFSIAAPTTIYLVLQGTFTVDTLKGYGTIEAWRVR